MKCNYCGAEVAEGQIFCLWCGTRQEKKTPAEEKTVPAVAPKPETVAQPAIPVPAVPETQGLERPQPQSVALEMFEPEEVPDRKTRYVPPRLRLPVKRGLWKMLFFGLLTLGIYPTVIWSRIVTELNLTASRYDGKRTMPYFGMLMLTPITLGIFAFVWIHRFCRRIGDELNRRDLDYRFGPATFWLWNVLGSLILVGPFVFLHKLLKAMNKINADYNICG